MNSDGQKKILPTLPLPQGGWPTPAAPAAPTPATATEGRVARRRRPRTPRTLRQRLLQLMILTALTALVVGGVIGAIVVQLQQERLAERYAAQLARVVAVSAPVEAERLPELASATGSRLFLVADDQRIQADSAGRLAESALGVTVPPQGSVRATIEQVEYFITDAATGAQPGEARLLVATPVASLLPAWLLWLPYALPLLLLSTGLALLIVRPRLEEVARPIENIVGAARKISEGDYDVRTEVPAEAGEVQQLARTFNLMANEMSEGRTAQRDFLSSVSHDLRTPLNSIEGYSQILRDGAVPADQTERVATTIYNEATRLSRLIQELLDLARIESGRLVMNQRSTTMNEVLARCMEATATDAAMAEVEVTLDIQRRTLPTFGDEERLEHTITTLIDHAIASAEQGGRHVQISSTLGGMRIPQRDGGASREESAATADLGRWWVEVLIRDDGPPLDVEEREQLFERLRQLDDSGESKLNVSLTVAREVVRAHGGDLMAREGRDQSNEMLLRLPMKMR